LDHDYFFGRERDRETIASNLYVAPLTVLYGVSGVGKSSVLLAGVVPELRGKKRVTVIVFRYWQAGFAEVLKREVLAEVKKRASKEKEASLLAIDASLSQQDSEEIKEVLRVLSASLRDEGEFDLSRMTLDDLLVGCADALNQRILLIFDQFEEYFLYHTPTTGSTGFDAEFARTVNTQEVGVNFLLAMREEELSKLDRFRARIPNLLGNLLRLENLDRKAARHAIIRPLKVYNRKFPDQAMTIEHALVKAVIEQVSSGYSSYDGNKQQAQHLNQPGSERTRAGIQASFLQMVLIRLWEEERAENSRRLRLSTLERLGGASNIARTHLLDVMNALSPGEQETAASVLRYLVTSTGAKIAQQPDTLASWAELGEEQVQPILTLLSMQHRILQKVAIPGQPDRYELYHDMLGPAILYWREQYDDKRKSARLRQQLEAQQAEQKAQERSRRLHFGIIALVVVAFLLGILYIRSDRLAVEASKQGALAREQSKLAISRELAGNAILQVQNDPELGMLLAIESAQAAPTIESTDALRQALTAYPCLFVMRDQAGEVQSADFSPDGTYILKTNSDGTASVWDVAARKNIATLGGEGDINSAEFSPDGKLILTVHDVGTNDDASFDKAPANYTGRIWAFADLKEPVAQFEHLSSGNSFFSPDSKQIAVGDEDGFVRVFDIASRTPVAELREENGVPLKFSPDGKIILTLNAKTESSISVWNVATERRIAVLRGYQPPLLGVHVDFSPDSKLIINTSGDKTVLLWNANTGKKLGVLTLPGEASQASFGPDGKSVLTISYEITNPTAVLWDVATRTKIVELRGHTRPINNAKFSPDGRLIVTASTDNTARVWLAATGQAISIFPGHNSDIDEAEFSPDGKLVVTAGLDGTARVWEVGNLIQEFQTQYRIFGASLSPDSTLLATAGGEYASGGKTVLNKFNTAQIWDLQKVQASDLKDSKEKANAIYFSPDGKRLVTSTDNGTKLWDTSSGKLIKNLNGKIYLYRNSNFSPDGRFLLTMGGQDESERGQDLKVARVWDANAGEQVAVLGGHQGDLRNAFFSPDGRVVVTIAGNYDRFRKAFGWPFGRDSSQGKEDPEDKSASVWIWDAKTWQRTRSLGEPKNGYPLGAAVSPDSRYVVVGYADKTARVWDLNTGALFKTLNHEAPVALTIFSPDGKFLLTVEWQGPTRLWETTNWQIIDELNDSKVSTILNISFSPNSKFVLMHVLGASEGALVWDAETARKMADFSGHTSGISASMFGPDSRSIVTASEDRTVLIYDCKVCVGPDELLKLARAHATRSLTPEERARYLHEPLPKG
jgi:WD40 repeat protein